MPRGSRRLQLSMMNMAGMGPLIGLMKAKNVSSLEEPIDGVEIGGVASCLAAAEQGDTNLFV